MQTPAAYLESVVIPARDAYNGFNLIVGDVKTGQFAYVGNRGAAATTDRGVVTRLSMACFRTQPTASYQ